MPARSAGEPLNAFMKKFMRDKHDKKKWPDKKQRLAVGFAEARKHAGKA
jgi:hypothetical protein